jgi:FecR protein
MKGKSGNQGNGSFHGMRGNMNDSVNDSHRALTDLIGAARDAFDGDLSARQQAGQVRFEQAVARRTLRSSAARGWAFGFGLVAAGAAAAFAMVRRTDSALTFAVVNGSVSDGGYVRAKASGGTELQFSDGSALALDPGTSTRVTDIDAHGSRVLLESGRAHVRVTHRPAARWTVDAGPYSVQVVGTEFDVRWSGSEEILDVQMQRGKIIVRGPLASAGLTMEAGQHLVANVKDGEIFLDAIPGSEAAANLPHARAEAPEPTFAKEPELAPAPAEAPAPTTEAVVPSHAAHARPGLGRASVAAVAPAGETSWSKLITQGDFQGVLADAQARGLDRTLGTAPAGDLTALADAARYLRRGDLARRALMAERDRFSSSVTGRDAAFFLGGLAEDQSGAAAAKTALDWYEKYLAESPRGTYAAQALGRQMMLVQKLRGAAAARPLANDYLARFPRGPYADSAKKLLQD